MSQASERISPRRAALGAWTLWGVSIGLLVLGSLFFAWSRDVTVATDWGFRGYPMVLALPFATVGAILASRRPHSPIGWIFCLVGVFSATQLVAEEYGVFGSQQESTEALARVAEWVGHWIWLPGAALFSVAVLLFPTGKALSPAWGRVRWAIIGGTVLAVIGFGLGSPRDMDLSGDNPIAISGVGDAANFLMWVGFGLLFVGLTLAAASVVVRMRRSIGDERQQFKWLVFGAALLPLGNLLASLPVPPLVQNIGVCALAGFPVAVGVAVLKYRLYDIDVVINRTLVYGALTGVLAMMYLGIVFVLQQALSGFTEGSNIAVAGSTLVVAALFSPLRSRIQTFIDHRFYRRRYDAVATLAGFSERLRDQVSLEALTSDLTRAVAVTMQPSHVSVWLRPRETSPGAKGRSGAR